MAIQTERLPRLKEPKTLDSVLIHIPHEIELATLETETSEMTSTPEGKFVLTYLLAARNVLKPILTDVHISQDLVQPIGGHGYNPDRTIDQIGLAVVDNVMQKITDIPNAWVWMNTYAYWKPKQPNTGIFEESDRFVIIDPLCGTNAIPKGERIQSTGIAIYNRKGDLLTIGVMSLVDDEMIFIDHLSKDHIHTTDHILSGDDKPRYDGPIRYATLTRRMHALKQLPIVSSGAWALDSIGGYSILAMLQNRIDTILDPIKGNPWFEYVLWGPAAKELGYTVTDPDGKPIDTSAIVKKAIASNPNSEYRIPFVISRTPEIHQKVLSMLKPVPST